MRTSENIYKVFFRSVASRAIVILSLFATFHHNACCCILADPCGDEQLKREGSSFARLGNTWPSHGFMQCMYVYFPFGGKKFHHCIMVDCIAGRFFKLRCHKNALDDDLTEAKGRDCWWDRRECAEATDCAGFC